MTVRIETPKGSKKKWEFKNKWIFKKYPNKFLFNYGSVVDTLACDGDELDCIILGRRLRRGKVLTLKPIGMLKEIDNGAVDNKIICFYGNPKNKKTVLKKYTTKIGIYKKGVVFVGVTGSEEALEHIRECRERKYKETIKKEVAKIKLKCRAGISESLIADVIEILKAAK